MKKTGIIIIMLLLVLSSCKKAELKKPTEVQFTIDLNKNESQNLNLKFVSGQINLGKFNLSGDRIEGDDVAFERPFFQGLSTDMNGSAEIDELNYDMPQGEYTQIKIDLSINESGTEPSLVLEGTYKPTSGPTLGVDFEFYGNQEIEIIGHDINGQSTIVMDKKLGKKVDINFNPNYWFELITINQLDNADVINTQGQDKILINPSNNSGIYSAVVSRIGMANSGTFK